MNTKLIVLLVVCGTLCVLSSLGLSACLVNQLSPYLATSESRMHDGHMFLIIIAAVPGTVTLMAGLALLWMGVRRAILVADAKG